MLKQIRAFGLILGLALLLQGCGPASSPAPTPGKSHGQSTSPPVNAAHSSTVQPTDDPNTFTNPVLDQDFPDPDVLKVGDTYYAYATNTGQTNVQAAKSTDLVHWTVLPDALPRTPKWAVKDFGWVWAPDVSYDAAAKRFVMYFVARFAIEKGGTQCIGAATSATPEGPFEPQGLKPLICQISDGGSIDPATFVDDDGQVYILWKNDGNSGGGISYIYIQKLGADRLSLEGEPTRLISADQIWEGVLVEGPTLWKKDGKYYLFYSANTFNDQRYAAGVARAEQILGPYTKQKQPFLKTTIPAGIVGPGGQDLVVGPKGGDWVVFHGWSPGGYRRMYLVPVQWVNGWPVAEIKDRKPIEKP